MLVDTTDKYLQYYIAWLFPILKQKEKTQKLEKDETSQVTETKEIDGAK